MTNFLSNVTAKIWAFDEVIDNNTKNEKYNTLSSVLDDIKNIISYLNSIFNSDDIYDILGDINKNEIISWGCP